MADGTQKHGDAGLCEEVQMTPVQCNEVIEKQLEHLQPALECTLAEMERLKEGLSNGEISWHDLLKRAIKKHESS